MLLLPVLAACGGGGDDDDDSGDAGPGASGSSSNSNKGGNSDAKLPQVKAATYGSGKVHVEISGDRDEKIDVDGSGIAQDGFALFTYASDNAGVQISFNNDSQS